LRKIGGILLGIGLGILVVWGLYWFFRLASYPLPAKIGIAAVVIGIVILLVSLGRERYKTSREEKGKFKGVDK